MRSSHHHPRKSSAFVKARRRRDFRITIALLVAAAAAAEMSKKNMEVNGWMDVTVGLHSMPYVAEMNPFSFISQPTLVVAMLLRSLLQRRGIRSRKEKLLAKRRHRRRICDEM